MMYNEFLMITGWTETYIPYDLYEEMIEPVYNEQNKDKHEWCRKVYEAHMVCVNTPIEMAISAHTVDEKEAYIMGESLVMDDVTALHIRLRDIFFRALKDSAFRRRYDI